jgi:hypothetical protein
MVVQRKKLSPHHNPDKPILSHSSLSYQAFFNWVYNMPTILKSQSLKLRNLTFESQLMGQRNSSERKCRGMVY